MALPSFSACFFLLLLARASLPPSPYPTLPRSPDRHLGTPADDTTAPIPSHIPSHPQLSLQSYTQYIPLSVHQLKDWAGTPAIFVLDCSAAGILLKHFVEPQPPVEEGDGVVNPDTPPRGDGSGGSGVGGAAAGNVGGPPSGMSESVALCFCRFFFVVLPVLCV